MVAALRSLLVATALFAVLASPARAQDPACDRNWTGGSGNWGDPAHWSGGAVPNTVERGCLPAGGYTVTVTGGSSPKGVTVGSAVTLLLKENQYVDARSGNFINHGTVRLEQNATLYGTLVNDGTVEDTGTIPGNSRPNLIGAIANTGTIRANQGLNLQRNDSTLESSGRLETATADALLNATGYGEAAITLSGTIANPGTMQFQGGTMKVRALTQTGNPPRTYASRLDLTGASGTIETLQQVDLLTNIPAAATVRVTGRDQEANLRLDGDHTNSGTLVFDSANQFTTANLTSTGVAARLANAGTLRTTGVSGTDRSMRIPITNTGAMTVDAGTRMVFPNDAGETISSGTWTVNGNVWAQGGSTRITQAGGTITVANGSALFFTNGGLYTHQGGTTSGEVQFQNGSSLDPSGSGAATYHVVGYATLAGDVNAAAVVNLEANGGQPAQLNLVAPRTLAGRLTFTTVGANAQDTAITGGQRLTVSGRVDVNRGSGGTRSFSVPLTITAGGQFNVEALANAIWNNNAVTDHQLAGTVTVNGGAYLGVRQGTQTVTQTAGTIAGAGAFSIENANAFVHQGGTITGELQTQNGASLNPSGGGAAVYHVVGWTKLEGDVNAAATLNVDSSSSNLAQLRLTANRTVAGRVNFTSSGPNAQETEANGFDSPYRLTITGRVDALKGSGGIRRFRVPVTVAATGQFNVEAGATAVFSSDGTVLNHEFAGTVSVPATAAFYVQVADQTITQTAGTITAAGTFDVQGNTFKHQGGTIAGVLTVSSGGVRGRLDPSGAGTATYKLVNSVNLIGDVNADADIQIGDQNASGQLYVRDTDLTNNGDIQAGFNGSPWGAGLYDDGQPRVLTNKGSIVTAAGGGRELNLRVINQGLLKATTSFGGLSAIEGQPLITNQGGTVIVDQASLTTWRGYTQTSGTTDLSQASLGSPRNPADIQILGGRLRGTGTLLGPVTNGGTIEVGRAGTYGKLEIKDVVDQIVRVAASYTQTANGRLAVDVGGKVAGTSFDQLTVDGPSTLAGALDVATAAGYTPTPNTDSYRVLVAESRTGTFADFTDGRSYTLTHDATGALLTGRTPPPPTGELTIAPASVTEGAGPLTFTVTLSKAATDPVSVEYTAEDDSALAGVDYTSTAGTLTIPAGSTSGTITVPVVDDNVVEPLKELLVRLRRPVNATLDVATAVGTIVPDDVGITGSAPNSAGNEGKATITLTGGGIAPGSTVTLSRAGQPDRKGEIVSGPERQSKLAVRFDLMDAALGAWTITVRTPSGASATAPLTVQNTPPALYGSLSVPSQLRYGWVGKAVLSLRNVGGNDIGIDMVRFAGRDLKVRAIGTTDFDTSVQLADTDLGDALVIPALSTRTVMVEVQSTTTVGHAYMGVDAEVFPTGYLAQTIKGSDPDPGTGSITGKVTTATGQPARGVRVTAFDGAHSAAAVTDGSGTYRLAPLKAGTYRVEALDAKASVAVDENARTADLTTGLADVSGTTGKGDATVAILHDGKAVETNAADANGGFSFRVPKPGDYTLVADSPTAGRATRAITVAAGVDQPGLTLTFGTRTLNVTAGAGTLVRVWPAGQQDLPSARIAAANGVASFTGLPAGELTVEARATGKAPARTTTTANAVTLAPAPAVALTGRVTAGAANVAGAIVTTGDSFAITAADGTYSLPNVAAGGHDVWALAPGYAPQVRRGASGTVDFAVVTAGETLAVSMASKRLGVIVRAVDPATGVLVATTVTRTGAQLGPLPAGTYSIEADGALPRTVTFGAGARKAAAGGSIEIDEDWWPHYREDGEDGYTDISSGIKEPQRNRLDQLGWDHVQQDYARPCPNADRVWDQLLALKKKKNVAFQRWLDTYQAIEQLGSAETALFLAKGAQLGANILATIMTAGKAPAGISGTLANVLTNGANYLGTVSQMVQNGTSYSTTDLAASLNDLTGTVMAALNDSHVGDAALNAQAVGWLTSVLGLLKATKESFDETLKFSDDVKQRGQGYLDAQNAYNRYIREINDLLQVYAEAKTHCPDPTDKGPKPPISPSGTIENITANDPNELYGPAGVGAEKWIPRSQALNYSIRFENLGPGSTNIPPGQQPASAPAALVKVVTDLSPAVDIDAVTLGGFGWGRLELNVPTGRTSWHAEVPLADGDFVRVDGKVDKAARRITWTLATIDPQTGDLDGSPTAGFLPPEDGKGAGQGHVDYLAGTADSLAQGTAISAKATITFDVNAPISTDTHTNTVDGVAPAATLTTGTASCEGKLPVSWSGTDTGAGVASYDVQVSSDKGLTWLPWQSGVTATSATYPGTPGQTYRFRVLARDAVGNVEAAPAAPDATVTLAPCDLLPPHTTATLPAGAVGGWYGAPVDVRLDAVDAPGGSGVATLRYAGKQVNAATASERVSSEGFTDFVFSAVDARGNAESEGHLPIRIDTAPPTVAGTDALAFALGAIAAPDATCADAGSGLAGCVVPAALDTSAAGTFSYAVSASDKLGHTTSRTFTYTVSAPPPAQQPSPPGSPTRTPTPTPPAGPSFSGKPVTVKLGKVTRTRAVLTLTSREAFAFTGKATLFSTAKKPKARSGAQAFSLAKGKSTTVTLKLKPALKKGKKVKLELRLELASGSVKRTLDLVVTLKAR